ncbi:MAG: protein kinase [Vicinamibacterales bacterium]
MTQAGVILGTAAYMSPEQAKGRFVDRRADVWAFGAVLFEMLAGTRAFPGEDITDTMVSVLSKEPDWSALPSGTPSGVRRLLGRCLKKDVRARLQSIGDARVHLEELLSGIPEELAPAPSANATTRVGSRSAMLAWIIAAVAALGMAVAAVPTLRHLRESPPVQLPIRFEIQAPPTEDPLSFAFRPMEGSSRSSQPPTATSRGCGSARWTRPRHSLWRGPTVRRTRSGRQIAARWVFSRAAG